MVQKSSNRQVAIPRQLETEVFVNQNLNVTIKQFDIDGEESVVWFSAENAALLIDAIRRAVSDINEIKSCDGEKC